MPCLRKNYQNSLKIKQEDVGNDNKQQKSTTDSDEVNKEQEIVET